jgi:tetratricopeptide (TPR) repeat protein
VRRLFAIIAAAALAALPVAAAAQAPVDLDAMAASNALYEDGLYRQAALSYQQLVDKGYGDPVLYYNLGNAYFKQGDVGRSILNYLRAERLSPRDGDIKANLDFARGQTLDVLEPGEAPLSGFVTSLLYRFTAGELGAVALALWLLFASCLLLAMVGPRRWLAWTRPAVLVTAGLLVLGGGSLAGRLYVDSASRDAVIVAEEVEVVSGPGSRYTPEFTLHAGAEAGLVEKRGAWARIALPGGSLQGWVPATSVEEVAVSRAPIP